MNLGVSCTPPWAAVRLPTFARVLSVLDQRTVLNLHIKEPGAGGVLVEQAVRLATETGHRVLRRCGALPKTPSA